MAAAPENDILPRLKIIEDNIELIRNVLNRGNVLWANLQSDINEVRDMIQLIIDDHNDDEHRVILEEMNDAVAQAAEFAFPLDARVEPDPREIHEALDLAVDRMNVLRSQHVGGYRKRKRRTHRKRRTQRKHNRKRTHRNRK